MSLICNFFEDPTIQCVVVEDGVQCLHGAHNKKRKLCTKHYQRMRRTGNIQLATKVQKQYAKLEEITMIERGMSIVCFCTHGFLDHYSIKRRKPLHCKVHDCECNEFVGIDDTALLRQVANKMARLGMEPLNNGVVCLPCKIHIPVGYWYDSFIFSRIREHLKTHQVRKYDLTAYRATG
jgi:hypothetical protein